jgi:hypothetical protein
MHPISELFATEHAIFRRLAYRHPFLLLFASLLTCLLGCGDPLKEANERIQSLQAQLKETTDKAEEQSKQWQQQSKELSQQMVKAADSLDPVAIKEIFHKYEDVSQINANLRQQLSQGAAGGYLYLRSTNLKLVLTRFLGVVKAKAWIDDEDSHNTVFVRDLRATSPKLGVQFNLARSYYQGLEKKHVMAPRSGGLFTAMHDQQLREAALELKDTIDTVDGNYLRAVNEAFDEYVKHGPFDTPVEKEEYFLERQLQRSGRHEIHLKVTPDSDRWELVVELFETGGSQPDRRLKTWQLNGDTINVNEPIEPLVVWVSYEAGTASSMPTGSVPRPAPQ